jgi:hypothetical protein
MEQFVKAVPNHIRKNINQELVDLINQSLADPNMGEMFRENILGYTGVMKDGRFKIEDYVNACKYVSYKLMGDSNVAAYTKTFPQRYQALVNNGTSDKDIASYVSAYNKNKLVNLIFEQTLIPVHVMNADIHQKAINHLAYLMLNAKSEKVQSDSAAKLVDALKAPEATKIKLDISLAEGSVIEDLRQTTRQLAQQQRELIESGAMRVKDVAHSKIIDDAEYVEIRND